MIPRPSDRMPDVRPASTAPHICGRYGPTSDNTTSSHVTVVAYGHHWAERKITHRVQAMDKPLASSRSKSQTSGLSPTEGSVSTGGSSHLKHPFENSKDLRIGTPSLRGYPRIQPRISSDIDLDWPCSRGYHCRCEMVGAGGVVRVSGPREPSSRLPRIDDLAPRGRVHKRIEACTPRFPQPLCSSHQFFFSTSQTSGLVPLLFVLSHDTPYHHVIPHCYHLPPHRSYLRQCLGQSGRPFPRP